MFRFRWVVQLTVLLGCIASLQAVDAEPLRIMPVGDSITQGGGGTPTTVGYRYDLYQTMTDAGADVDYVGSGDKLFNNNTPSAAEYPNYFTSFDRDHEGHWGWTAATVNNNFAGYLNGLGPNVPDVVLIHLGTNDLRQTQHSLSQRITNAINGIDGIIDKTRAANSDARFYIATIDDAFSHNFVGQYNSALSVYAQGKTTTQSAVGIVDLVGNGYNISTMTYDGTHMNRAGEQFTAEQFYNALVADAVVVAPEPGTMMMALSTTMTLATVRRLLTVPPRCTG